MPRFPDRSLLIHDDADRRPEVPRRPPHAIISGADFDRPPRHPAPALPWQLWLIIGLVVSGLVVFLVVRFDQALRSWSYSSAFAGLIYDNAVPAILFVLAGSGLYWLAGNVYWSVQQRKARAFQEIVTRTRLGQPMSAAAAARMSPGDVLAFEQAAIDLELGRAPYTKYPLLSTLSEGNKESAETYINAGGEGELPDDSRVPPAQWLRWVDETPHLMIAGRTNAGKTTLASAILAERIQAGDEVLIIDPHDQPGKWFGIPAIGGGRKFEDILTMLDQVVREMDTRYQVYTNGAGTATFRRLTVLVDEVPAIMDACVSEGRRLVDVRWSLFARKLGSEARKVRISVLLLTQSVLVQDIGINTAMRKNFSRIALGDEVRKLIREEPDTARRAEIEEAVRGQAHPAVMEYLSEIHVLNTDEVPQLARRDVGDLARVWRPAAAPTATANQKQPDRAALKEKIRRLSPDERLRQLRLALAARDPNTRTGYKWTTDYLRDLFGIDQRILIALSQEVRHGARNGVPAE